MHKGKPKLKVDVSCLVLTIQMIMNKTPCHYLYFGLIVYNLTSVRLWNFFNGGSELVTLKCPNMEQGLITAQGGNVAKIDKRTGWIFLIQMSH